MTLQPATILSIWGCFVGGLQCFELPVLVGVAAFVILLGSLFARQRSWTLVRRTKWILLSLVILFLFSTPGQRLSGSLGDAGMTWDGLMLAGEHVLRLVTLLISLAVVHQALGTEGLMTGIFHLLYPLAIWTSLRERIVVRLMLVLDQVESAPALGFREWLQRDLGGPSELHLRSSRFGALDWSVFAALMATLAWIIGR